MARKVHDAVREPLEVRGLTLDLGVSNGIACLPEHGDDVDELLQRADVAMYLAKERRSGVEVYARDHDRNSTGRLVLVSELREAIDSRRLALMYQPKVDLASGRTARATRR